MADDSLLWDHDPVRLPQPRPREHVWSMRSHKGRVLESQLLNQGEYGTEVQFFIDGVFYQSRRWPTRAEALAEVEEKRKELEQEGWTSV